MGSKTSEQMYAEMERKRQTRALEEQAKAAKEQTRIMQRQEYEANKERKRQRRENGKTRFHFIYFLFIGCWLSLFLVAMIFPLFFSGGRRLIKKAFGIW